MESKMTSVAVAAATATATATATTSNWKGDDGDDNVGGGASGGGGGGGGSRKFFFKEIRDAITVEPTYALYSVAETMSKFLHQAFLLDKLTYAGRGQEPSPLDRRAAAAAVAAGTEASAAEAEAVKFVAFANSCLVTPAIVVTVLCTVLAISWSDKAGRRRRPLIFVPLFGLTLECACAAVHAHFWRWSVRWLLATYTLTQVAFGGRICFAQSVYLYVADITTKRNRTARYGLLMSIRFFAVPLGYAVAGFLLRAVGFFYSFATAFALCAAAAALGCALIGDISVPVGRKAGLCEMIDPRHSLRSVRVLLKRRPQNSRAILAMTLVAFSLFSFTYEGELSVIFLYFRHKFAWNESQIGVYLTYKLFAVGVGTLVCSMLFSKWLKMDDGSIGVFIGVAKTTAALCYAFADADWQLYVVPLIDMYFAAGITITRSFATKLVTSDELGRLAAVISLTKISIPSSQSLYNLLLARTMDSSFFFVSAFFAIVILLLTGASQILYRKRNCKIVDEQLLS